MFEAVKYVHMVILSSALTNGETVSKARGEHGRGSQTEL